MGVWCQDKPNKKSVIHWNEIFDIVGYKQDYIFSVDTILSLGFVFGKDFELNSTWQGFADVVEEITLQMPFLGKNGFDRVEELNTEDESIIIWRKKL